MKHLKNPKQPVDQPTPYVIVTVLVDEVQFTQITPKVIVIIPILKFQNSNINSGYSQTKI